MDADIRLRMNGPDPLRHDLRLLFSDGLDCGDDLAVHIGQADPVVVDEIEGADAGPGQRLADVSAHASDPENRHPASRQAVHGLRSQQQPGPGKLILHKGWVLSFVCLGRRLARPKPPARLKCLFNCVQVSAPAFPETIPARLSHLHDTSSQHSNRFACLPRAAKCGRIPRNRKPDEARSSPEEEMS